MHDSNQCLYLFFFSSQIKKINTNVLINDGDLATIESRILEPNGIFTVGKQTSIYVFQNQTVILVEQIAYITGTNSHGRSGTNRG